MKMLHNEKGIALVTSLMFTVLTLVITMALLYMVTASIRTSGAIKRYRTTTEAAYGGTDIMVKDLITASFAFHDYSVAHPGTTFTSYMQNTYMVSLNSPYVNSNCFRAKLSTPKSQWPSACSDVTFSDISHSPDVSFNLNATPGQQPYVVYSKIVDTMERKFKVFRNHSSVTVTMAGNSDTSTSALEGGATTDGAGVTVPHYPYMYRMEIQAVRQQNPAEKAKISVQYAY
jgi:hypothetical protein